MDERTKGTKKGLQGVTKKGLDENPQRPDFGIVARYEVL